MSSKQVEVKVVINNINNAKELPQEDIDLLETLSPEELAELAGAIRQLPEAEFWKMVRLIADAATKRRRETPDRIQDYSGFNPRKLYKGGRASGK